MTVLKGGNNFRLKNRLILPQQKYSKDAYSLTEHNNTFEITPHFNFYRSFIVVHHSQGSQEQGILLNLTKCNMT